VLLQVIVASAILNIKLVDLKKVQILRNYLKA